MNNPMLFAKSTGVMGKVSLQRALHSYLRHCERNLIRAKNVNSPFARKSALNKAMFSIRLMTARLLSLLRCYKNSASIVALDAAKNTIEGVLSKTNQTLYYLQRNLYEHFYVQRNPEMAVNYVDFYFPKGKNINIQHLITNIMHEYIPSRIKDIKILGRKIYFLAPNEYRFSIEISRSGKICFTGVELWLKATNFDLKENLSYKTYILNIAAQCKTTLSTSQHIFMDIDICIHSYYIWGHFLQICYILKKNEEFFGYKTAKAENERSITIQFPTNYAPRNIFDISISNSGVHLCSRAPMKTTIRSSDDCGQFLTYTLNNLEEADICTILGEIKEYVYRARLNLVYEKVVRACSSLSILFIKCKLLDNAVIMMIRDKTVFRISLDWKTGEYDVDYSLYPQYSPMIMQAVHSEEFDRVKIFHRIFVNFLSIDMFINIIGPHCNAINNIGSFEFDGNQRVVFSFAPTASVVIAENLYHIMVAPRAAGEPITTNQILALNNVKTRSITPLIFPALVSAKNAIILRRLLEVFMDNGIETKIATNSLKFIVPQFGAVNFYLSRNSRYSWILLFENPRVGVPVKFDFRVVCESVSLRFVDWIYNFVGLMGKYMCIIKQAVKVESLQSTVKKIEFDNHLNFTIEFANQDCNPLKFFIDGLEYDHTDTYGVEVYRVNSGITPEIKYKFLTNDSYQYHLAPMLLSDYSSYFLSSFLTVYYIPLKRFHSVFLSDPSNDNWTVSVIRDGCQFSLIYKRFCSILTQIQSAHTFIFSFSSISKGFLMLIAVTSHPNYIWSPRMKIGTIKAHMSQIESIKQMIEEFFEEIQLLGRLGFGKPAPVLIGLPQGAFPTQVKVTSPEYCPYVNCTLDSGGITIGLDDRNSPKFLSGLLSINVLLKSRKQKQLFIKFIFSVLRTAGGKGNEFLAALKDINELPGELIDWPKTLENDLDVNFENKSVIFTNLSTKIGVFFLQVFLETDSVEIISENGKIIEKVRSIRQLKGWFKSFMCDEEIPEVDAFAGF